MNGKLIQGLEASARMGSCYMNGKLVHEWEASTRIGN